MNKTTTIISELLIIATICQGCAALGPAALAGAGGAGGALAGQKLGDGSIGPIILGGALGAGIATAVGIEMQRKAAREKAEAFEEGRRYEREIESQEKWYKATLEPEDPNIGEKPRTSKQVRATEPAGTIGGMRFSERETLQKTLP